MNDFRQPQETLWHKKRLFQSIVDESPHLVLILDPEGNISYCSPSSKTLLGLIPDVLTGAHITQWTHRAHLAELNAILAGPWKAPTPKRRIPLRFRHQDDHWQEFDVAFHSLTDEAHGLIGVIFHAHARTETPSLQRPLQEIGPEAKSDTSSEEHFASFDQRHFWQTQKLTNMGSLVSGITHDFNNVLTVILGYGEILKSKLANHPELNEVVAGIRNASFSALSLTQQLMPLGQKKDLCLSVLDLNRLVLNLENLLNHMMDKRLSVHFDLHPTPLPIKADAGQIEQVLTNLVTNARDAVAAGGEVRVSTECVHIPKPFVHDNRHLPAGNYAVLTISDTGCGMSPKIFSRIFDPFFTTKQGKGNGLGLAVIRRITVQHHGFIDVVSEAGKGSTFRVHLPRTEEKPSGIEPTPGAVAPPAPTSTHTVLLVEKEEPLRRFLRHLLESQEYEVLEACDGRKALDVAIFHKTFIHLLVTSIMSAMDGKSLGQEITGHHSGIRVLYISGRLDPAIAWKTLGATEDFLEKPFSPETFLKKVRDLLRQQELDATSPFQGQSMSIGNDQVIRLEGNSANLSCA